MLESVTVSTNKDVACCTAVTASAFEYVAVPDVEILPFASMIILLPAINADTTLEFVNYKLLANSVVNIGRTAVFTLASV